MTGVRATVLFLALAALAAIPGVACGGEEPGVADSVDAGALLAAAADRAEELRSFHFVLEHEGGGTEIVLGLLMIGAEGDVSGTDRMRVEVDARFLAANVRAEIVVIGDEAWIKVPPFVNRWRAEAISLDQVFDPASGVTALMRAVEGARVSGIESVGGARAYVVEATVASGDLTLFGEPEPGRTLRARVWIGVDAPLVYRIEVVGAVSSAEDPDLVRRLTLSRFDAEIAIEPPD